MSSKRHKQMRREAKAMMEKQGRTIRTDPHYVEDRIIKTTARNGNELDMRTKVIKRIYKQFQREGKIQ